MSETWNIHAASRRSGGFTLLEVLIALVILSIGLLGIAGLQSVGLRGSHSAYLTSQASLLAYDMADRVRANPAARTTYDAHVHGDVDCDNPPSTPLATADLAEWACAINDLLPEGTGTISSADSAIPGAVSYTIRVEWQDRLQEEGATDPWSYELVVEI